MKKFFVGVLAIAGLVACAQEEVLRTQAPGQIGFDGAYVENAVRAAEDPSTTTDNLKAFDVWGYMTDGTGIVFNREVVSGGTGAWDYVNKQYWIPGKDYRFFALAPAKTANAAITLDADPFNNAMSVVFTNVDGTEDLLYASATRTTESTITEQPEAVKFSFDHLLSKVKFSFKNGITNPNAYIVVEDIQMEVPAQGTIALDEQAAYKWTDLANTTTTLSFGAMDKAAKIGGTSKGECDYERLTIPAPATQAYKVTFYVTFYQGGVEAFPKRQMSTEITGCLLEPGKAYNFYATLDENNIAENPLYPITFDVEEVKDWEDGGIYDGGVLGIDYLTTTNVAAGETLTLTDNAKIQKSLNVAGTLDGAGYTLYADAYPQSNKLVVASGDATIKNVKVNGLGYNYDDNGTTKVLRGIFIEKGGNYTIDNVTVVGTGYSINTGTQDVGTLTVTNSTLEGWASYDKNFTAEFKNVQFTKGQYHTLRPQNDLVLTNCTFEEGYEVLLDLMVEGSSICFVNCNLAGVALTAENIDTLVTGHDAAKCTIHFARVQDGLSVAAGETTTLSEDVVLTSALVVDGTLDGAGNTITVSNTNNNGIILVNNTSAVSDVEVKNVTVDGGNNRTDAGVLLRGLFFNNAGKYVVDNVTVLGCGYAINVNTSENYELVVSNSTLQGWTSFGGDETSTASFTNVKFIKGNYFQNAESPAWDYSVAPYVDTVFEKCSFDKGFVVATDNRADANDTIVFKQCTVEGNVLTADNYTQYITITDATTPTILFE